MATHYILHGGNMDSSADRGKAFFEEITKDMAAPAKLLLCYYARPREGWERLFSLHSEIIRSFLPYKQPVLEMAMPEVFADQSGKNDALVIFGGDSDLLYYRMNMTADFLHPWKGKTVAGTSAGAQLLADKYYSLSWRKVRDGLGVLPENILVHYGGSYGADDPRGPIDWSRAEQELQAVAGKDQKIIKLQEGQFVTIEK
jgi:hypothetical protein